MFPLMIPHVAATKLACCVTCLFGVLMLLQRTSLLRHMNVWCCSKWLFLGVAVSNHFLMMIRDVASPLFWCYISWLLDVAFCWFSMLLQNRLRCYNDWFLMLQLFLFSPRSMNFFRSSKSMNFVYVLATIKSWPHRTLLPMWPLMCATCSFLFYFIN